MRPDPTPAVCPRRGVRILDGSFYAGPAGAAWTAARRGGADFLANGDPQRHPLVPVFFTDEYLPGGSPMVEPIPTVLNPCMAAFLAALLLLRDWDS